MRSDPMSRSLEKAQEWLNGDFEARGPYTQVHLDHDVAVLIARQCLSEHITPAEAARRLIRQALGLA